ncbi:MAG: hypothetical protein AAF799_07820 [Myxococcota bacterium]
MPSTKKKYEKSKVALKVKVTRNPTKVKTVHFIPSFDPENEAFDTSPIKASYSKSKATHDYVLPDVPDGLDKYKVSFKASVDYRGGSNGTQEQNVDEKYLVYVKEAKVILTSDNNKDHKKAKFRLNGGKKPVTKQAKQNGQWTGQAPLGPWSVSDAAPFELVDVQEQTGRERTYKVKKNAYKAIFKTAGINDGNSFKQYVNLEPEGSWSTQQPFGHEIELEVTGENNLAQQNDIVYVKVEFSDRTKRSHPVPELKTTNVGSPTKSNSNKTFEGKVKLDSKGTGKFKVVLGYAGGEKCNISIGMTDDYTDATVEFVTWRRISYELMYPDFMEPDMDSTHSLGYDIHTGIKSVATSRLAPTFVEYELNKLHRFTAKEARKDVIAGDKCGFPGRDRMVFGRGQSSFPKAFEGGDLTRIGILMTEITGGDLSSYKPLRKTVAGKTRSLTVKGWMLRWNFKRGSGKWEAVVDNPAQYEGPPGTFTHPGLNQDGTPRKGKLDDGVFSWESTSKVKVVLPDSNPDDPGSIVGNHSAQKCKIKVSCSIKTAGKVNGFKASDGRQVMCIKPGKNLGAIASTLCHELGHSMGMTIVSTRSKVPPGMPEPATVDAGGLYYCEDVELDGNGYRDLGQGPHCAHGVPNKAHPKFEDKRGTCIMFHCGGDKDDRPAFCDTCKDYIKARKLVDLHKPWNARKTNDY